MVRGLRRSYSRVVCFLRMPSAMMVTGVSEHTSVAQLASTSSSVSSSLANSLCDHELDKQHEQKLHDNKTTSVSCIWPNCPPPEARPCQITGTVYLEKRTNLPGFRIHDSRVYTRRIGLQKRWTKCQFSVAAIFSHQRLRVEKTQASKMTLFKLLYTA